ncbi:MAG TPA: LLM class flavin-dependent oxidoreductase [Polyangiales bacterium]|nr:LLM class flavin-dependent oxidoreductase [Polyangiales bacterium]
MRSGQMHLNVFLMDAGHHEAAWRLPEANPHIGYDVPALQELARTAERGKLDSLFIADIPALWMGFAQRPQAALDPLLLLTMMAAVTSRVGLIATLSTTYNEPYNLARRVATLDHLSGGRAGWNIVTTPGREVARNFGLDDQPDHAGRYVRAGEFVEVCLKLWDSWEDDAVLADKERGVWGDDGKLHPAQHRGAHYSVQGALNVPRMPQGYPLLVQAGSSEDGKAFAARWAEAVFTSQPTLEEGQRFYRDVKALAQRELAILPGLVAVIGGTEAEAQAKQAELDALINPLYTRKHLSRLLRVEPERLVLDEELPADLPDESQIEGGKSRFSLIVGLARREKLTVRQLIARFGRSRGHHTVIGTPEQVADAMCSWWEGCAADGFNLMPPYAQAFPDFVEHVVPILQKRGVFRREYSGVTLREHYGVPRPANRYAR